MDKTNNENFIFGLERGKFKTLVGLPLFSLFIFLFLISFSSAIPSNCDATLPGGQQCAIQGSGNTTVYNNITNNYINQTVNATVNSTQFDSNNPIHIKESWLTTFITNIANSLGFVNSYTNIAMTNQSNVFSDNQILNSSGGIFTKYTNDTSSGLDFLVGRDADGTGVISNQQNKDILFGTNNLERCRLSKNGIFSCSNNVIFPNVCYSNGTNCMSSATMNYTNLALTNQSNIFLGNNTIVNLNATGYIYGKPIMGMLGSGLIGSSEGTGTKIKDINVTCSGLTCTYNRFEMRITSGDVSSSAIYCNISNGTLTVPDNTNNMYYIDRNCAVQRTTYDTWFSTTLGNGGVWDFANILTHSGSSEIIDTISLEERRLLKARVLNYYEWQTKVLSGFNFETSVFPAFNITSGKYVYGMDVVDMNKHTINATDELEVIGHINSTAWLFDDQTGLNITSCDNGTAIIPCTGSNYRRHFIFNVGYDSAGSSSELHQLLPSSDRNYLTLATCLDTTTNPLTYTLPNEYTGSAVLLYAYCAKRTDSSWTTTNLIDLRTVKSGSESAGGDTSSLVPYTGATSNVNLGVYNVTTTGNINAPNLCLSNGTNCQSIPSLTNYALKNQSQTFVGTQTFGAISTSTLTATSSVTSPQIYATNAITYTYGIENFNPFTSWKIPDSIYTNLIVGKGLKLNVSIDGVEDRVASNQISDQDYEAYNGQIKGLDGDANKTININFINRGAYGTNGNSSGITYPSGKIYFNFYANGYLPSAWSGRVKRANGTWYDLPITNVTTSTLVGTMPTTNYVTDIEFTFSTGTGAPYVTSNIKWTLVEVDYQGTRMALSQGGLLTALGGYVGGNVNSDANITAVKINATNLMYENNSRVCTSTNGLCNSTSSTMNYTNLALTNQSNTFTANQSIPNMCQSNGTNCLSGGDNSSWNESKANTLYQPIENQRVSTTNDVNFSSVKVDVTNALCYFGASRALFGGDLTCDNDDLNIWGATATNLGLTGKVTTIFGDVTFWDTILGHIIPKTSNTYDLGSSALKWANVWATNGYFTNINNITQNDARYYNKTQYKVNRTTATFNTSSGTYVPMITLIVDAGYANNKVHCHGNGFSSVATTGLHFQGDITGATQNSWDGTYYTSATSASLNCVSDATSSIQCEPASGSLTGRTFDLFGNSIQSTNGVFTLSVKSEIATTSSIAIYRYAFCEMEQWN